MDQTTVTLNQGQQDAAEGFFKFLFGPDKEMGITGPGGVGKTFLLGYMIDKIMPQYFETCKLMGVDPDFESVQMTSTTNKAAEVLSLDCGRPTSTVQSFLNLKVHDDYATGKSSLVKTRNWTVHERKILFVDECSLIDTPLHRTINEGTQDCKIVYVGDHCQMAPITETISPVFCSNIPFYHLTEPRRTGNPHLQALNQQLRDTVETGQFQPIKIIPGVIDLLDGNQMEAEIAARFTAQTLEARVLAYTNKRAIEYNDHIRYIRGLPDAFTVGEFLINNHALPLKSYMLSVEEEVEIINIHPKVIRLHVDCFGGEDVYLEVQDCDIKTRLGMTFTGVKLPCDRVHYSALLKWLAQRKAWAKVYSLKHMILDLRQRDSSTVYKAQGSSLDTVLIDATNISLCHNPSQVARMLYVAASRARHRVVFYGELAAKYGGLLI
jgi:exodeoxyribonuclease-5